MLLLFGLLLKHWYVDFVMQTDVMVAEKGIYGKLGGVVHSLQHGVCTYFICLAFVDVPIAGCLAMFDSITHYHIDWIKMNYGNRDITSPKFWHHLGLDQLAHQVVYLIIYSFVFTYGVML